METRTEVKEVAEQLAIFKEKKVLTADEAAKYMGISKSYLYKLTMGRKIPFSKPMGKMCYFDRDALESFLMSNRVSTETELSKAADKYSKVRKGVIL
jgi:excisionase family DNA binding protein